MLARLARDPGFESHSGHVISFPCGGQYGFVLDTWVCEETVSSVAAWFRADSRTNLIKQGETFGLVAQW